VFGGVYPRPDPLPDDCSNELYVFNLFEENWYKPLVMGTKPSPRSGHSATLFHNRLVAPGTGTRTMGSVTTANSTPNYS